MIHIGCHLSVSDGYEAMGETMLRFGGDTFAWFTRNPRGGKAKPIDAADAAALNLLLKTKGFGALVAHGSYTMNLCAANPQTLANGRDMLREDLERMESFPGNFYNFHPGSHVKQGVEIGTNYIAALLNELIKPEQKTIVLLETMAGKGTEIGRTFEELKAIIDRVECKDKIGVCLDSCHVYDGGYDIVNNLDDVFKTFDKVIGLDKLYAVHLNDSKNPFGSHKDRHELIGKGSIGLDAITAFINHQAVRTLPIVLETPNDLNGYKEEIAMLRGLYKE